MSTLVTRTNCLGMGLSAVMYATSAWAISRLWGWWAFACYVLAEVLVIGSAIVCETLSGSSDAGAIK